MSGHYTGLTCLKEVNQTLQYFELLSGPLYFYYMHFEPSEIYLVYNRGNNNQPIFFNDDNYSFFLRKIKTEWLPLCEILGYCLMPDHFRFFVIPNAIACRNIVIKEKETHLQVFSKTIGKTLSSYARAINIEQSTTGSLFQKKTRAKHISKKKLSIITIEEYLSDFINETHQEPVHTGLVSIPQDWTYSSARNYDGLCDDTFCNKELLNQLIGIGEKDMGQKNFYVKKEQPIHDLQIKSVRPLEWPDLLKNQEFYNIFKGFQLLPLPK